MRKIISTLTGALLILSASIAALAAGNLPVIKVNGREFYYYEVKSGDSLYGLTKTYEWNTDTLRRYNSDLDGQMHKGRKIYYPVPQAPAAVIPAKPLKPLTPAPPLRDTVTKKEPVAAPDTIRHSQPATQSFFHTIREGDTLFALAREYDTSVASIEALNPGLKEEHLRVGSVIRIAKGNGSESLVNVPAQPLLDADSVRQGPVQITLLLPDPQSKRDIDFLRGFVLGIDELGVPQEKLTVSVLDCGTDASAVLTDPRVRDADLVVTTYDKDFPDLLSETCTDFGVPLVNVFDVKTTQYERNPDFIQLLPPTEIFNTIIADETARRFAGSTFLFVGSDPNPDPDSMTATLLQALADKDITLLTLADTDALAAYDFDPAAHYVIVADYSRRADAERIAETVNSKNKLTGADISLFGRPNWVVFADRLRERTPNTDVFIPSRFYFDASDTLSSEFAENFSTAYDQKPVKSSPMFSVMGHDVAAALVAPLSSGHRKDFARAASGIRPLQLPVNLQRAKGTRPGFVNNSAMFVHIRPGGSIEIIDLR